MGSVQLDFHLRDAPASDPSLNSTLVSSSISIEVVDPSKPLADLVFDCEDVELRHVKINGKTIDNYVLGDHKLTRPSSTLPKDAKQFHVETLSALNPASNLQLSGLYKSSGMYCTQCEAEGFRRITPFFDRPDMLTKYKVRLEADKSKYPILLSNGNKVEAGDVDGGINHYAVWEDPFNKPSYLFALVAGDLASIQDSFITKSNRKVHLEIFSEKENVDQLDHAMRSLKRAMKWDEDRFGLEYDLDIYNIVAVGDFNSKPGYQHTHITCVFLFVYFCVVLKCLFYEISL
jgi:aminopeptidase N